jgi:hypothetical protein
VVDLLFSSSGIESQICRDADPLEVAPGLRVPVAHGGHLVAMKLLSITKDGQKFIAVIGGNLDPSPLTMVIRTVVR